MSEVIIISSFGELVCEDFKVNRDSDCLNKDKPVEDLPLPETEVSE